VKAFNPTEQMQYNIRNLIKETKMNVIFISLKMYKIKFILKPSFFSILVNRNTILYLLAVITYLF